MGRTKFDRLDVGGADIVVFRVSGTLGFHEKAVVERLAEECLKRNFKRVLFDFTALTSLGGGVAKILREFVKRVGGHGGEVGFIVKSDVVLDFLQDGNTSFSTYSSLEEALGEEIGAGESPPVIKEGHGGVQQPDPRPVNTPSEGGGDGGGAGDVMHPQEVILMSYDDSWTAQEKNGAGTSPAGDRANAGHEPGTSGDGRGAAGDTVTTAQQDTNHMADSEHVFSEIFGGDTPGGPPNWINKPTSPFRESGSQEQQEDGQISDLNKKLKRRILELKTLFSISKDFSAIRDKKKLLDIFLLTSIAQGGVESAAFFERTGDTFNPVMSKGLELGRLESVAVSFRERMDLGYDSIVMPVDDFFVDQERDTLKARGLEHVCTFKQEGRLVGLVLLGKRIAGRGMKREDFEFLQVLVTVAQSSYENAVMFEREHERTLGIVKTLISLIEENTLLKGTSEFVSRYVGIVAKDIGYPEEDFKDLIYGTVLRDMGMIKVSDLILRSPRDLTKEEWEIIKKHPEDGADMLRRMKFSNNVVEIVKAHHERFNGDGYPMGLVGREIPLGARIISVVESYAAMIHERPNRPALSEREALDTLKENYGLRYDREIVQHFVQIMEKEIAKSVRPGITV
jgi:HD-GYP domain-containing protein (c-di-GMP phosphodiesterase class II)/anti-anti-sigma regulatory factor